MILALSLLAGVGAALFHPEAALLVNRMSQSNELGNAMGRFAVVWQRWFCIGSAPFAGGVYVLAVNSFGCSRPLP